MESGMPREPRGGTPPKHDEVTEVFGPGAAFCIPVAVICGVIGAPWMLTAGLGAYGAFSAYKLFRNR